VKELADSDPGALSREAVDLMSQDSELRSLIVSVGLPIVIPGPLVYRGSEVIVPLTGGDGGEGDLERVVPRGWVDLRPDNCRTWIGRAAKAVEQATTGELSIGGTGSDADWQAITPDEAIQPAKFATWIFKYEDDAQRIKR
jgi:hypothetical protein